MPRLRRFALTSLIFVVVLAATAATAAGATWTAPIDVTGRTNASALGDFPAFEANGAVNFGLVTDTAYETVVARHAPGAVTFATSGVIGSVRNTQARIAMTTRPDGAAAMAWAEYGAAGYTLVVAERASQSGAWGTSSELSTGTGGVDSPRMATLADGTYVVVWSQVPNRLMVSRKPLGGSWSTPTQVAPSFTLYEEPSTLGRLLVGPHGEMAVAAGARTVSADAYREVVFESTDGGVTWTGTDLGASMADSTDLPTAVFGPDGSLWASWYRYQGDVLDYAVVVAHREAAGTWADAAQPVVLNVALGNGRAKAVSPSIAVAPDGDVYVALANSDPEHNPGGLNTTIDVHSFHAGAWGGPVSVTPPGDWFRPHIAIAGNGAVVVTSVGATTPTMPLGLYSTVKLPGGSWSPAVSFDSPNPVSQNGASLDTGPTGDVVAAWSEFGRTKMAAYGVGPVVTSVTVPATARTNQAVSVAVSANSPWTASPATVQWFVDGDPAVDAPRATGSTASLAITAPGVHFVYVRVTDANGAQQRKSEVVVSLPPLPPDADGDGLPDSSDCAPSDRDKPAHGGVADVNCNGVDDVTDAAVEAARQKAIADAIKLAQEQTLAAIQATILKGFMFGAQQAQKALPKFAPVAAVASGTMPIGYEASGPQNDVTQMSVNIGANGVIAAGGGNVIAAGGGNVIAPGGGNVIAAGGGNTLPPAVANLINASGVVAAGGGNVIAPGGANSLRAARAAAPKTKQVLLGGAGYRFKGPGKAKAKLRLTPAGRAVFAAYRAKAQQLRAKHRPVPPLIVRITTIVGPAKYGNGTATYTTKTFTIRG